MKTKPEILKEYSSVKIISEKEYTEAKQKLTQDEFKLHYSTQAVKKLTDVDNFNILPYYTDEQEYYYIDTINEDELKLNFLYEILNEIKQLGENIVLIKYFSLFFILLFVVTTIYFLISYI